MSDSAEAVSAPPVSQPVDPVSPAPGGQGAGREFDRTQRAVKALEALRAKARPQSDTAEKAAPAPEPEIQPEPEKPSAAPVSEATQAKQDVADVGELQRKLEAAMADAQRRDRETWELKQAREALDAKLKQIEERDARLRTNPLDALKEIAGVSYDQLTKEILQGKYKPPSEEQIKLSDTDKRLAEMQRKLDAIEQEKAEAAAKAARANDLEYAKGRVSERADALPFLSAFEWGPERAVSAFYGAKESGQQADFEALVSELDKSISSDVRAVIANERALKALLSDSAVRDTLTKALGLVSEPRKASPASRERAPKSGDGPSTITQEAVTAPGVRESQKPTDRDRISAARAAIQALRERGAQ